MFLSDLRDLERKAPPEMQTMTQLFARVAPNLVKKRANANGPPFEEALLPTKLNNYTSDIRCLVDS